MARRAPGLRHPQRVRAPPKGRVGCLQFEFRRRFVDLLSGVPAGLACALTRAVGAWPCRRENSMSPSETPSRKFKPGCNLKLQTSRRTRYQPFTLPM
jgi:hypothetical protein